MDALSVLIPSIADRLQTPASRITGNIVHGGSINQCYRLQVGVKTYFCKINNSQFFPQMFDAEKLGLATIAATGTVRVPTCEHLIETGNFQCLLLEWIEPKDPGSNFWESFGESLVRMHSVTHTLPGFHSDNYMGSVRQVNKPGKTWSEFFVEQRLQVQVSLAAKNQLLEKSDIDSFDRLYPKIDDLMPDEPNVLLHGDLWSGNFLCDSSEQAVIFDPAVYYGLRHVDLAMTTLFGGFDHGFYEAYQYHSPLPSNYKQIWELLNLYPLLIHLNLFGSSYRRSILNVLKHF